jgi:hypothetical protein
MAIYSYHYRIFANLQFDERQVYDKPVDTRLKRFTEVIWHGKDDEGWCVYRRDPITGEKIRIDFQPPYY